MSQPFVHLHTHSSYSLLDGLGRIDDLVHAAQANGMPALALTDHGTMFGAIEFYSKAKELGVKPIIGCEVYVADKPIEEKAGPGSRSYHLLLLASNEVGYRNLIHLTTEAHLNGFYRKPRVDHQLLEKYNDGLICLSGCASAEVPSLILDGQLSAAEERADWYHQIFGDRYYMEIQDHQLAIDAPITAGVVEIAHRLGLPLVATNDVHYVRPDHAVTHEILLCIQTQTTMSDPKRMRLETPEFYLKSADEMATLFSNYPDSIANTLEITERCNLDLAFGRPQLPRFATPDGQSSESYLRLLCSQGVRRRYGDISASIQQRLDYELDVICSTDFVDYFLLVHDVIHFARGAGIAVGPGRGSAAGSIVAYVLYLTNVDPIEHGLSFERFLNPERVNMPDMDLDFADDRRDEVIRYVTEKYGRDRVAQIITFGTLGPRAGVRDVGKVKGMALSDVDRVAKMIPFMCSKVSKAKDEVAELQQLYDQDPAIHELLDTVETLEGVARHASTHAAGVVISRDPLTEHVPLYKVPKNEQVTTQYAMASIEKIGLLKMDFLGLRTLTILERARAFVEQTTGEPVDLDRIPLNHPSIYELLSAGDTFGVFQVDGSGFRKLMRELKPTEFNHIVAAGALYRPGPMEQIPKFVARKNGLEHVAYDHPALEEVLEETFGIVVYQDQVMRLAVRVAGYSMGEADLLRRAMGKKKPEELAKHRQAFIDRAGALGTDSKTAEHLFNIVEPFAGYAFNKAHAAAYAVITCQTAYLKANHPREYMAGLLSAELENSDKIAEAMAECRRLGVEVLPPDVNASSSDFTLESDSIRFGLCAVKHVGSSAIESILSTRLEGGRFSGVEDFCSRIDWQVVNKKVIESLGRCGALDSLGIERGRLLASLDKLVAFGTHLQRTSAAGQVSLFGEGDQPPAMLQLAIADAASLEEKLAWEQELLGIFVSPHPLTTAEQAIRDCGAVQVSSLGPEHDGKRTRGAGIIRGLRSFSTKAGQPMATFQLADLQTAVEVVVFSRTYEQVSPKLVDNTLVVVDAKVDSSDGRLRLVADTILALDEALQQPLRSPAGNLRRNGASPQNGQHATSNGSSPPPSVPSELRAASRIVIEVPRSDDRAADLAVIERLYDVLQRFPGQDEVEIVVRHASRLLPLPLPNKSVRVCEQLKSAVTVIVPASCCSVVVGNGLQV